MTGDDRLRVELDALERAAPTGGLPATESARARPWGRIGLVSATAVAAIVLTSLAFGLGRSLDVGSRSSSPDPSEPPANAPAVAETRVGNFILTISSPKTIWTTEEVVEVTAELRYVGGEQDMTIRQANPPIGFTLGAASGEGPTLVSIHEHTCLHYAVSASDPLVQAYRKGGPISEDGIPLDEAPPFDRAFLDDPELRLPVGEWRFTALTSFNERACGSDYQLEAAIVLEVTDAPASDPPAPSPSIAPSDSPVAGEVCRDSNFDPIGHLVTRDDLERDLERIAAAVQDEATYAGMYISDDKGPWSGLEAVLRTTSCDIESLLPELDHADRLRIELVERSFDDLRVVHSAIGRARRDLAAAGEEIVGFGLDTMANAVRVTYLKGTMPADIVGAGGVPPAFAAQFGTDGIVFEVIDQLPQARVVPGVPLSSASAIPQSPD
jgi:hypothetical protein